MSPSRCSRAPVPGVDSAMLDMELTSAPPASVPDIVQPNGAAPAPDSRTSSENSTQTELREVAVADSTYGAAPSDTGMFWRAASALDDESAMAPEPEPGSVPTSVPDVSYRSSTPSGFVSAMFPERVSTMARALTAAVLSSTVRPAASVPDTDHPCAVVSDMVSGSLKVTRILSWAVATADDIVGARFSVTATEEPARSMSAASFTSPAEASYDSVTSPIGTEKAGETVSTTEPEFERAG